jgi:hypothetical protein
MRDEADHGAPLTIALILMKPKGRAALNKVPYSLCSAPLPDFALAHTSAQHHALSGEREARTAISHHDSLSYCGESPTKDL